VHLWGAGGGAYGCGGFAGAGAYVTGLLRVPAPTTLRIIVGMAGMQSCAGNGVDAKGYGGDGYCISGQGCGGGGRSAIQTGGSPWIEEVTAGGGGGMAVFEFCQCVPSGFLFIYFASHRRPRAPAPPTRVVPARPAR
jgi:hypothetical protein